MRTAHTALVLLVGLLALGAAPPGAGDPIGRVDRMWVVGSPVLDEPGTPRGLYAWVEERAVALAAVGGSRRTVYRLRVRSTQPLRLSELGDFSVRKRFSDDHVLLEARPKAGVARGRLRSAGDVTLTDASRGRRRARVFVGPLARPAAHAVTIGRF